jgi:hypothetical protein
MAERAFQEASLPEVDVRARKLIQWVHKHGLEQFNAKDTRRAIGGAFRESNAMDEACGVLVDAHLIRLAPSRKGPTPGRPAKIVSSGHGLPLRDGKVYAGAGYYLNELTVPVRALMKGGLRNHLRQSQRQHAANGCQFSHSPVLRWGRG